MVNGAECFGHRCGAAVAGQGELVDGVGPECGGGGPPGVRVDGEDERGGAGRPGNAYRSQRLMRPSARSAALSKWCDTGGSPSLAS